MASYDGAASSTGAFSAQVAGALVEFYPSASTAGVFAAQVAGVTVEYYPSVDNEINADGSAVVIAEFMKSVANAASIVSTAAAPRTFTELVANAGTLASAVSGYRDINGDASASGAVAGAGACVASFNVSAESLAHIISGLQFVADYWDGWAYNLNTGAPSYYEQFKFNSFAQVGKNYYGLNDDGIYLLSGATDAGDDIDTVATLGQTDFGDMSIKTMPAIYAGIRTDGVVELTATVDGNSYTYAFKSSEAQKASGNILPTRVKTGRGLEGRYWQIEVSNKDGSSFEMDALDLPVVPKSRRV